MLSYKEALDIILDAGAKRPLSSEFVEITKVTGRIAASDVQAAVANPPFDNSAMDGYALKAADLGGAEEKPVTLKVAGHIAAGELRRFESPEAGHCYAIMTGAPVPPGCDTVVPVEKTEKIAEDVISFRGTFRADENIRRAGADFKAGDIVLVDRTVLQPGHVLALATLGTGKVEVVRKAKVMLLSTGQEIVDSFDTPLGHGQIYNSTKPYLIATMAEPTVDLNDAGTMRDDPAAFRAKLEELLRQDPDLCISTGAVSAGVHDFVPSVLQEMGAEIFFHKVAIRPGKPLLFAKFPGKGPFYVGLPGNPAASAAGLQFFVRPLIRAMQGLPPEMPQYAVLKNDYNKGDLPLRFFMRARLSQNHDGVCEVDVPQKQQSFMVSPFAGSNVWAAIPEDASGLKAGTVIEVYQ